MRNNELKQIEIMIVDKYDKARYYTAIMHYKNANYNYAIVLLRMKGLIQPLDREGFNRSSGNIIRFNSAFKTVSQHNTYPADTILDSNW